MSIVTGNRLNWRIPKLDEKNVCVLITGYSNLPLNIISTNG